MAWPPPRAYIATDMILVERDAMPRKQKPRPDDTAQSDRFRKLAHELEAEKCDTKAFDRAFHKVATAPHTAREPMKKRAR